MDFAGVDPIETPIPVQPGQHYSMGGLACDENGETRISGLFVVGECSCISVHGANRLGGNSLLETIVFGKRAGDTACERVDAVEGGGESLVGQALAEERREMQALKGRETGERQIRLRRAMQDAMTEHVGVFREASGLRRAVELMGELKERYRDVVLDHTGRGFNYDLVDTLELRGMLELAEVTALTALERTECRGSHWRTDHLGRDDEHWLVHSLASYRAGGQPRVEYKDVMITEYPPEKRDY
jgi:succinate dehydrogenase / fumarate reductase flavoprotein subunit